MIRKASFLSWDASADTTTYKFPLLGDSGKSGSPDDPMAAALAVLAAREKGLDRFLGATLAFAPVQERPAYRQVLARGLDELEALLRRDGLL
jgi:hypothetical protein